MAVCFISHATADRSFVQTQLLGLLNAIGTETWFSVESISTAADWERSILSGLESCDWFMLVMSTSALNSRWVKDELHWAIDNRPERIIPVLVERCEPAAFHIGLRRLQYVDFTVDTDSAKNKLIKLLIDAEFRPIRRGSVIAGNWNGRARQEHGPDGPPIEYPVQLQMDVQRQNIGGRMVIDNAGSRGPQMLEFHISGGFFHDQYLQLSYTASNPAYIQFGSVVLELDDEGRR